MTIVLRKQRVLAGSRVGFIGTVNIRRKPAVLTGSAIRIRGDEHYAPEYWRAERYFEWQDTLWDAPPSRERKVKVGEV
ncbi:MAG: hypothetical protein ABIP44_09825 [Pseudoxanthomonas sp.]